MIINLDPYIIKKIQKTSFNDYILIIWIKTYPSETAIYKLTINRILISSVEKYPTEKVKWEKWNLVYSILDIVFHVPLKIIHLNCVKRKKYGQMNYHDSLEQMKKVTGKIVY